MHRPLLALTFLLAFCVAKAQHSYGGVTVDYSSGIGQRYTYGVGFNLEVRIRNTENVYLNWHYAAGTTTHNESYLRGPVSVMLYKDPDWWDPGPHATLGSLFGLLIGPAICPVGVTFYTTRTHHTGTRFGFYVNPFELDYWDRSPLAVTGWTIESGIKFIEESRTGMCLYFSAGCAYTNNVANKGNQAVGYGNTGTVNMSLGIMHAKYD